MVYIYMSTCAPVEMISVEAKHAFLFSALPFVCTSSEKKNGENPMDGLIPVDEISDVSKNPSKPNLIPSMIWFGMDATEWFVFQSTRKYPNLSSARAS